VNKRVDS